VDDAVRRGARVLAGGRIESDGRACSSDGLGTFYAPTVLVDVPEDARVAVEEIFGPIACVIKVGGWLVAGRRLVGGWSAAGRWLVGGWSVAGRRLVGGWSAAGPCHACVGKAEGKGPCHACVAKAEGKAAASPVAAAAKKRRRPALPPPSPRVCPPPPAPPVCRGGCEGERVSSNGSLLTALF
jgi:hypothetical protein